ncbi:MAG: membrane protein insertion efficiency factor YidD [Myxococcota bacterium]
MSVGLLTALGCAPSARATPVDLCCAPHPAPFTSSRSAPAIAEAEEPWHAMEPHGVEPDGDGATGLMEFAYHFYSEHLTKVDGPRCEHRPTCSRYSIEAMRAHGFVVGSWLTIDRLLRRRRSSRLRPLPVQEVREGEALYHDPLEENDFFF